MFVQTTHRRVVWLGLTLGFLALGLLRCPDTLTGQDQETPTLERKVKERTGAQVYRAQCAACHGEKGEGTEEYPDRLEGTHSLAELTDFIHQQMPDGDPEKCVDEEARRVAAFVFGAFYSSAAQARNRQDEARIELSRLTVRQYRNAVTDLITNFGEPIEQGDQHGLRGRYYTARRLRGDPGNATLDRRDARLQFYFGVLGPDLKNADASQFDPHQFSIRWEGSVITPETGEYELILKTNQSARMWFNDLPADRRRAKSGDGRRDIKPPLIDAYVKSGDDVNHSKSVFLVGGRAYPLRVELFKSKQGVDDSKENPPQPTNAFIELQWRPPHQTAHVIPQRNLLPVRVPRCFVVTTPFPPDDRSQGYERGTSVSKAWDEATTGAAIEVADFVVDNLSTIVNSVPATDSQDGAANGPESGSAQESSEASARRFCRQFAERAFRQPLPPELSHRVVDRQFEKAPDIETAVKRVVLLVLKSPRFLYPGLSSGAPAYDSASQLSFAIWDSLPDRRLLSEAAAGRLSESDQIARQAERMLKDPRARSKLRDFLMQWLKVDDVPELAKNRERFPNFDEAVASDLRTSLELFLDSVVRSDDADFRQLLLDTTLYVNGRLAGLYGVDLPADASFRRVAITAERRAGILTHPYLMAHFAYPESSSPIHRGVFLARNILGRALRPPLEAFTPLPAELHPDLTTRDRITLQTKPAACLNCHSVINPLGFALENFDAIGRYRDHENGQPIDPTGGYRTSDGKTIEFEGVADLADYLANDSKEAQVAFIEQLFRYLVKQPIYAYGPETLARLQSKFSENGYNIRKLIVEMMIISCLTPVSDEVPAEDER